MMGLPGVTIGRPNFRDGPSLASNIHRWIEAGTKVDVLRRENDYFEVTIGAEKGFLHVDHVVPDTEIKPAAAPVSETAASSGMPGVTIQRPNFRTAADLNSTVIRMLQPGTRLQVLRRENDYFEVLIGEERGFVHTELVQPFDPSAPPPPPPPPRPATAIDGAPGFLRAESSLAGIPLRPATQAASGSSEAGIWNNYGGLLGELSRIVGIDPAVAVAVLTHESGGQAFGGDGRLLIRFENHLFNEEWGTANAATFATHFACGSPAWTGHVWRPNGAEDFRSFHGNQPAEWQCFEFACGLDDRVAKRSISMGLTQILGRNYQIVGYHNVQDMFTAFSQDIRAHILGFFDFVRSNNGVGMLQRQDYAAFARMYNGPGQVDRYRGLIAGSVGVCQGLGIT